MMTSVPKELIPGQVSRLDKPVHFSMYAVLGWLLARQVQVPASRWAAPAVALLIASGFGAIDEWHQQFIPGRTTDHADWQADTLGAAAGALVSVLYFRRRARTITTE